MLCTQVTDRGVRLVCTVTCFSISSLFFFFTDRHWAIVSLAVFWSPLCQMYIWLGDQPHSFLAII